MCFYLFILYFLWRRLRIWNRFVAIGIGNPIFPDFFRFLIEKGNEGPVVFGDLGRWGGGLEMQFVEKKNQPKNSIIKSNKYSNLT